MFVSNNRAFSFLFINFSNILKPSIFRPSGKSISNCVRKLHCFCFVQLVQLVQQKVIQ